MQNIGTVFMLRLKIRALFFLEARPIEFFATFLQSQKKWLGAESNRRHTDFQSAALPTELPSQDKKPTIRLKSAYKGKSMPKVFMKERLGEYTVRL